MFREWMSSSACSLVRSDWHLASVLESGRLPLKQLRDNEDFTHRQQMGVVLQVMGSYEAGRRASSAETFTPFPSLNVDNRECKPFFVTFCTLCEVIALVPIRLDGVSRLTLSTVPGSSIRLEEGSRPSTFNSLGASHSRQILLE